MLRQILTVLENMASQDRIRRGTAVIALKVTWAVFNYASLLFAARVLSNSDFGTLSFIFALVTFLGTLANLGIQNGALRFINEYRAKQQRSFLLGTINAALRISTKSALFVVLAGQCIVALLAFTGTIERPVATAVAIGLLLVPGFTLVETHAAIGRSFGSIFLALAPRDVVWRGLLIPLAFISTMSFVDTSIQLEFYLACAVALMWLAIVLQRLGLQRLYRNRLRDVVPDEDLPTWKRVALPLWISAIGTASLRTLDVIVLGLVIEPAQLGGYFAASRTAMLLSFVHSSINVLAGPRIANAFHGNDRRRLSRVLSLSSLVAFLPALFLFIILAVLGKQILMVFSPSFVTAWPVMMVLATGQLVSTFCGSLGPMFDLTGNERKSLQILLEAAIPAMGLLLILGYYAGPIGAAFAVSGWQIYRNIRMLAFSRRNIGYDTSIFSLWFQKKLR